MKENNERPFVASAFFCEKVLDEKDDAISAIRIIDKTTITANDPNAPEAMPRVTIPVVAVLTFISGPALGKRILSLRMIQPGGNTVEPGATIPIVFDGGHFGARILVNTSLQSSTPGVHWFDVLINDEVITRMPFEIKYLRTHDTNRSQSGDDGAAATVPQDQ